MLPIVSIVSASQARHQEVHKGIPQSEPIQQTDQTQSKNVGNSGHLTLLIPFVEERSNRKLVCALCEPSELI
jgi:hypothetical protein